MDKVFLYKMQTVISLVLEGVLFEFNTLYGPLRNEILLWW